MKKWFWAVGAVALVLIFVSTQTCLSTGFRYGLWLNKCPDGELRQTINVTAPSLMRGHGAQVNVFVTAHYTTGGADVRLTAPLKNFTSTLSLLSASGEPVLLEPTTEGRWKSNGDGAVATIQVPIVPDGDYRLRAQVTSQLGSSTLDVAMPLYAPARLHVLTDRPLYEPGNTVKFRALALRASDLSPLDGRPGLWRVTDPNGEVLLEERANAGDWGVVAGSFPLDRGAVSGSWQVSWVSGDDSQTRAFTVKPFTLPRFSVEAAPAKPFYRRNERPVLKGTVKYSSGAPVANAKVSMAWRINGEWPAPASWVDNSALPKLATTSATGTFSVDLPPVPDDLQKHAVMAAALSAVDSAGDVVEGSATVLLSEDLIEVSAVSELADGLVEGFNNRLYLRATTADGRVLDGVTLNVKRLWEPSDKGTDAPVDEDGVANLQVDPGPPVNVVIPAMPFRPPPKIDPVQRQELVDSLNEISLADRLSFDQIEKRLDPCARYVDSAGTAATVGVLVHANGTVAAMSGSSDRLGKCLRSALSSLRFEAGHERLIQATYSFNDEDLPRLSTNIRALPEVPPEVQTAFDGVMADVRDCLPSTISSGSFSSMATWRHEPGSREMALSWVNNPNGARFDGAVIGCVQGRLSKLTFARVPNLNDGEPAEPGAPSAVGITEFTVKAPGKYEADRPQETVMTGYEFLVTAKRGREVLGTTKLLMSPGAIPMVRLRASSQIVNPGEVVTVELLRGPDFTGELPENLYFSHASSLVKSDVDAETHKATFTVPNVEGWASVEWSNARLVFYVRPRAPLAVKVRPDKARYAPGQIAQLGIETVIGGKGGPAAVGLFGVDESLAQLAPLPGADELSALRPGATSSPAFGGIDAQALSMGRVRGANAAAATLLRVTAMPQPPATDRWLSLQGQTFFDPNETLVDRFYVVLEELHVQARSWEESAPAKEKLTPRTLASLWNKAISSVEARKESARDAWGRTLRLHRLPADLLALTEPRQVVVDGTRLPEDSENWSAWVSKEKP